MLNRQNEFEMPFGQFAYPFGGSNVFGPTCPFCGMPQGSPYGGGSCPGSGPGPFCGPFGGGFGPGPGPFGGQCPYRGYPWMR